MVLSPAPNPRRSSANSACTNWTSRFSRASASRPAKMNRLFLPGFVLMGALTLGSGLIPRSEAQQMAQSANPVLSASLPATDAALNSDSNSSNAAPLMPLLAAKPTEASSVPATSVHTTPPLSSSQNFSQKPVAPVIFNAPLEKQPTIGISAIIAGKARTGEVVVKPKLTVVQALAAIGISLAVLDRVVPEASALARDGMTIRVERISKKVEKHSVAIPAEVRYQPTTAIKAGTKKQIQSPRAGALEISETVWRKNGQVTKRDFVSQRVARAPQHRVIALGVMSHLMPKAIKPSKRYKSALTSRSGSWGDRLRAKTPNLPPANPDHFKAIRSINVVATGYSAGRAGGAISNWTCTGVRCTYGAVAVDPRLIPLGSKLYIEGYGYGFACDIGGAIKGKHIDLAFNSPRAAFANGRRKTKVWILAPDR